MKHTPAEVKALAAQALEVVVNSPAEAEMEVERKEILIHLIQLGDYMTRSSNSIVGQGGCGRDEFVEMCELIVASQGVNFKKTTMHLKTIVQSLTVV